MQQNVVFSFIYFTFKLLTIAELALILSSSVAVADITVQQVVFYKMIVPAHSFASSTVKDMVN